MVPIVLDVQAIAVGDAYRQLIQRVHGLRRQSPRHKHEINFLQRRSSNADIATHQIRKVSLALGDGFLATRERNFLVDNPELKLVSIHF